MHTNFYISWRINDTITMTLHVGASSRGVMTMFSGEVFPTREAWRTFLEHNYYSLVLRDEDGTEHDINKFIKDHLSDDSPSGADAMLIERLGALVRKEPLPTGANVRPAYWMDGEHLFYGGYFR